MPEGGFTASFADQGVRFIIKLLTHPATQQLLHHAIRVGTAEVVKAIRRHARTRKGTMHLS